VEIEGVEPSGLGCRAPRRRPATPTEVQRNRASGEAPVSLRIVSLFQTKTQGRSSAMSKLRWEDPPISLHGIPFGEALKGILAVKRCATTKRRPEWSWPGSI
jgi:hypothetical protein